MNTRRASCLNRIPGFLLLCALALPAQADGIAPCGEHAWLKLPPPALDAEHPAPLYMEVKPEVRDEATRMLETRPAARLTPEQAQRFTGEPSQSWVPGLTFLMRGVRNADQDSRYAVTYAFGGEVVVHFASRRALGKPYSAPMVVVLEQTPTALYVTCMAGQ
jgi:hypothetical protein